MTDQTGQLPEKPTLLIPKDRDIGGLIVKRVLPQIGCKMIGPFVFVDRMGPAELAAGKGIDVRPHPHIGLATVTYLFDGAMQHKDSLGSDQRIVPGDINWMTAGAGIVHSERTPIDERNELAALDGLQCWVALPRKYEESAPRFRHHGSKEMPVVRDKDVQINVLLGKIFGAESPVLTMSDTVYCDVQLKAGATLAVPTRGREIGLMPIMGEVTIDGNAAPVTSITVSRLGEERVVHATTDARFMILGGEPLGEQRFMWWNFVSSSKERIEQAKADWAENRFPKVPGDEIEFTPLPEK